MNATEKRNKKRRDEKLKEKERASSLEEQFREHQAAKKNGKLKGVQLALPTTIKFTDIRIMREASDRFTSYQGTNLKPENWVTLIGSKDAELQITGPAEAVKAAAQKIEEITRLLPKTEDGAHIAVTAQGEAYFQHGDIRFPVDRENLSKTLGCGQWQNEASCIDKLMDSEVITLATANGFSVSPYVRNLVTKPLIGLVQLVWYRDLEHHTSEHLDSGQNKRVAEYHEMLAEYKEPKEGEAPRKRAAGGGTVRADKWSRSFQIVAKFDAKKIASGRETQLYEVVRSFKRAVSFADIVKAADGKVKTKQKLDAIVDRFLKELVEHGAIQEVKA